MARVRDTDRETDTRGVGTNAYTGCRITGQRRHSDGTPDCTALQVTPERPGVFNGVVYDTSPIFVLPDENGVFDLTLPPSSVMGAYKVQVGQLTLNLIVPDASMARFEDGIEF